MDQEGLTGKVVSKVFERQDEILPYHDIGEVTFVMTFNYLHGRMNNIKTENSIYVTR